MPVFLNNCRNRPHADLFPAERGLVAFFDLAKAGRQGSQAIGLRRGTECIVVCRQGTTHARFDSYAFSHEATARARDEDDDVRVFFGRRLGEPVVLPQVDAARRDPYSTLFNARGWFKRGSVIAHTV